MSLFKLSPQSLISKKGLEPIVAITAYDFVSARLAETVGFDFILVGDSASMVMLGHEDTYPITMEEMLLFCQAVARGAPNTLRIGDMPFLSYHTSLDEAIRNAGRFIKEGRCHAVKIEGGKEILPLVKRLVELGIPVLGHIGVTPQRSLELGGLKVRGKDWQKAKELLKTAKALEKAGCFALILECIPAELSQIITESLSIPTIGIGAGLPTDGQILVFHDVVGLLPGFRPKFVKNYLSGFEIFKSALEKYKEEVKGRKFPTLEHSYSLSPSLVGRLQKWVKGKKKRPKSHP